MAGFAIKDIKCFVMIPYNTEKGQWLKPTIIDPNIVGQFHKTTELIMKFMKDSTDILTELKATGINFKKNEQLAKLFGPTTAICNYGFSGFEGMKARRSKVNERYVLIPTPERNLYRLRKLINFYKAEGTRPEKLPMEYWMEALALLIKEHASVIPRSNEGAYYIRPIFATGEQLGMEIHPNTPRGLAIFGTPVKDYYPSELQVYTLTEEVRCMPGGTGGIKSTANYSMSMHGQRKAREEGFDDALFLDETLINPNKAGIEGNIYKTELLDLLDCNIQELAVANVCIVKNGVLCSPIERDTILPSTTKRHIFQIAKELLRIGVIEENITLRDLLTSDEAFACGTAANITPIVEVGIKNERFKINRGAHGEIMQKIKQHMLEIYWGEKDPFNWMFKIEL